MYVKNVRQFIKSHNGKPSNLPLVGAIVYLQPYDHRIFSELFVIVCNGMYTQGSMRLKQCQCLLLDHFEHGTRSMSVESGCYAVFE